MGNGMAKNQELGAKLEDVLKCIQLKKRLELSEQIEALCLHHKIENTFMKNRVALHQEARNSAARKSFKRLVELRRLHLKRYWVEVQNQMLPKPCSLKEAAELMMVTETSIRVRVGNTRTFEKEIYLKHSRTGERIEGRYICTRMSEEELNYYSELFKKEHK
jgi:hypothetical protein